MKRLAAMQLWPLLIMRALTAAATHLGSGASARTMKGSLPPSSRTTFFRLAAGGGGHLAAGALAAGQGDGPDLRQGDQRLDLVRADAQRGEDMLRETGAAQDLLDAPRRSAGRWRRA